MGQGTGEHRELEQRRNGAGEGLGASVSMNGTGGRNKLGHWLPGTSGNPRGRPSKAAELAMLDAINSAFTPEEVTQHLKDAMKLAKEQNSARSIVAVLEFINDRTMGKPIQRVQREDGGLVDILEQLRSVDIKSE